ncbi:hypothetical protein MUK42_27833 [Musa troglodytarum]|uniref:Uncharacterized protein n=1 Tax=Musa troglodytarum TaxID=320322 RepID=A0A9E7F1D2_9LILI|nr:hypothetical protein MUK42_27833 [Musa troglodytarum]
MARVRLSLPLNCAGARFSLAGAIGKRGNTSLASACDFSQGLLAEFPCSSVSSDAQNIRRWPLIASLLGREICMSSWSSNRVVHWVENKPYC